MNMKLALCFFAFTLFLGALADSSDSDNDKCEHKGCRQSPINVAANYTGIFNRRPRLFAKESQLKFNPNGGNFHMDCEGNCGWLQYGDGCFPFKQVHMHSPSEHTINGMRYPLEMHFVHEQDHHAVFGVLFKGVTKDNEELEKILQLAEHKGHGKVNLMKLSGAKKVDRCAYQGSLTTKPFTEETHWVVSMKTEEASWDQIRRYKELVGRKANARKLQDLHGRPVVCYRDGSDNNNGYVSVGDSGSDSGNDSDYDYSSDDSDS